MKNTLTILTNTKTDIEISNKIKIISYTYLTDQRQIQNEYERERRFIYQRIIDDFEQNAHKLNVEQLRIIHTMITGFIALQQIHIPCHNCNNPEEPRRVVRRMERGRRNEEM